MEKESNFNWVVKWLLPAGLSLIVSYQQTQMQDMKQTQKETESRVLFLYTDKVGKQELRDTEDRITRNLEGLKTDILGRLDLYFKKPS